MKRTTSFDVIVIGSGSAGFSAVQAAHAQGVSVCLIEQDRLGGECPNHACIPSKALLKASVFYRTLNRARDFGIELGGKSFQFKKVMDYRQKVVDAITGGGERGDRYVELLDHLDIDRRFGRASFLDPQTIEVNGERLYAKTFVIATGSSDFIPPIVGLENVRFWTWREALETNRQPKSLAIIGAGPVGCEVATFYASFGTRVLLLQAPSVILEREDKDISLLAQEVLEHMGVEVIVNAQIDAIVPARGGVAGLSVSSQDFPTKMHAVEQIVVAAGKRPNIEGLNVNLAGIQLDKHGYLKTKKDQGTTVPHIFAAGDVDGGLLFTHTAHQEGWIAGSHAAFFAKSKKGKRFQKDQRVIPRVTFLESEVASVGFRQEEIQMRYGKVLVGKCAVSSLGRAVTEGGTSGMIKLVAHPKSRKLFGAHMIGERAGEVIHEAALAIYLNATIDKLAEMIHAFPTFSEGLKAAASVARIE